MRLSWPIRPNNRRILTDGEEDAEGRMVVVETPVSYDMPSSPGSVSTTNDAATLIASPEHRSSLPITNNRRISRYGAQQLEAISMVASDDDEEDDDYEQKRQLLTDVSSFKFAFCAQIDRIDIFIICFFLNNVIDVLWFYGCGWWCR